MVPELDLVWCVLDIWGGPWTLEQCSIKVRAVPRDADQGMMPTTKTPTRMLTSMLCFRCRALRTCIMSTRHSSCVLLSAREAPPWTCFAAVF